jgi:hypothetical protein
VHLIVDRHGRRGDAEQCGTEHDGAECHSRVHADCPGVQLRLDREVLDLGLVCAVAMKRSQPEKYEALLAD